MRNFNKILNIILGTLLAVSIVIILLQHFNAPECPQFIPADKDTIVVVQHDTIRHTEVIKQDKWHYDTIRYRDTVYIKDEPKQYVDSTDDYTLSINAVKLYDYSLDLYKVDTVWQIKEVLVEQPKQKWKLREHIDWYVGFGVTYGIINKQFDVGPTVGVAITF